MRRNRRQNERGNVLVFVTPTLVEPPASAAWSTGSGRVQEVLVSPDKIGQGSSICPGDPRFDAGACGAGLGPGSGKPRDARHPALLG